MKYLSLFLVLVLAGCAGSMTPVAAPKTFVEQVYAARLAVQESEKSLGNLICWPESQPDCIGKPITVDKGLQAFNQYTVVHTTLDALNAVQNGNSVIDCVGTQKSATACLATARLVLNQVETQYLRSQK